MFVKTFITFFLGMAPLPARAGGSSPPSGGMVLALVAVAIALAAVLCASSTTSGIDRAMRLSWWFS
ncbi:hypothetical protein ACFSHT_01015 [Paraburkholderia silviterrae]|uniref:Uncharacterized protein n=1 Tax=Paraburkholderia silviterrae TaxID=2528715 RepID=A0A4R5MFY5_9BURK|nr:hypothetical protein [Paraburkholderia silviterrae]TDG26193.1 hypothetical protein EYW47_02225 [Paraburkholderia silviterrae]